mgnify:CR=1 FL=1
MVTISGVRARRNIVASDVIDAGSGNGAVGTAGRRSPISAVSIGLAITSRGKVRYTGPCGSACAIDSARSTTVWSCSALRSSYSHLTLSRTIDAWSNISCVQWMCRLRAPNTSFSLIGVRPAANSTGTCARAAFSTPHTALAVPTLTWTITACMRRVTSQ